MLRISDWIQHPAAAVVLWSALVAASVLRIVATYPNTSQAYDEAGHIAAGMQFLDKGTYTLDQVHPPLAPVAIAVPLYISGLRYPQLPGPQTDYTYTVIGNHILYDGGDLARHLALARTGVLPFFIFGAAVVYLWARHLAGSRAGLVATFLYCTTPTVLAFASVAYTDIAAAAMQLMAMLVFSLWLENPNRKTTLWLGLALGAAFLAKLTTLLFLPAAMLAMTFVWLIKRGKSKLPLRKRLLQLVAVAVIVPFIIWAGYFFSLHHVQEITGITPSNMPSWQHFPAPVRSLARGLIVHNPRIPAGEFLDGIALAFVLNQDSSESYLLGQTKAGGWWYFFLIALAVKSPIPLLLLTLLGFCASGFRSAGIHAPPAERADSRWTALLPLAAVAGILVATTRVSYQVGLRHILVVLPLMTIIAAVGAGQIFERIPRLWRWAFFALVGVLLLWQGAESVRAQSDFLAYFNEFAGSDPSAILVTGCDLDCGQDLNRLAAELRRRHIDHVELAVFSSADLDQLGLPPHELPDPNGRPHGWIAVSDRPRRTGTGIHENLPPGYFAGLEAYRPVATVGKTIRLYYVPEVGSTP